MPSSTPAFMKCFTEKNLHPLSSFNLFIIHLFLFFLTKTYLLYFSLTADEPSSKGSILSATPTPSSNPSS
ncbi:unnamed protein product [Cuscuta epithymum]|uniref:Uncharacterized protein n=1 Tax=Cuscuta epithymum TaxID=186058 RepID=A0AAV0FJR1_9ASTE|nr:unnamed protein product [Cuscuta epithymum]